jgi:4-diphosphocytidyl-2-C-methyl-D-erythritol kinase
MIVTGFAPAKVNLYLHVGAARADGLHPIDSVVAFAADVGDFVSASPASSLTLSLSGRFAPALAGERDNLVLRAARALAAAAGIEARAALSLDKQLPIASGVGGGSSDAAATLRVLNRLWRVGAGEEDLERVAATLGADAPACVRARTARMRGLGEALSASALPAFDAVLVNPLTPAATGAVYRAFDALELGGPLGDPGEAPAHDPLPWLARRGNDLDLAARGVAPVIGEVIDLLTRAAPDALVRLSGSGATCFALTPTPDDAAEAARAVAAARPAWWVRTARLGGVDVTPSEG